MVGTLESADKGRRRSVEIRVKLSPALAESFASIADARGLLPATLAACALGEYVERHQQQASISRMVALDSSKRLSEAFLSDGHMETHLQAALANPGVLSVLGLTSQSSPEAA